MKKILLLIVLPILLYTSCKKDPPINQQGDQIYPGAICFTLNNNVTLKQAAYTILGLGINQYTLDNFYYTQTVYNDSSLYYWHIFKSCGYLYCFSVGSNGFQDFDFKNLDSTKLANWSSIVKQHSLIEMPYGADGYSRDGILYVPVGQEKVWIDKLNSLSIINNASFMYEGTPEGY
ncbi:MAG: hypothetical protein ACYDCN_16205 [Bacteroidia bacterium]